MIEQLESDLREALQRRAAEVPVDARSRLRALDYHPRTIGIGPRFAFGAFTGAAGTAAVVISIVGLGAGARDAFAGWSAAPTRASSAQVADAQATCESQLAANKTPAPFSTAGLTGWQVALIDTRGPFSFLILQSGRYDAECFSAPSFTNLAGYGYALDPGTPAVGIQLQSDGLQLLAPDGQPYDDQGPAGSAYRIIEGRAGSNVTAVTLVRSDGTQVQATTENGWFAAWWPGTQNATTADITTATGTTTQQLPFTLPVPSCILQGHWSACNDGATNNTGNVGHTGPTATTENTQ
jgi:hypothetical protein